MFKELENSLNQAVQKATSKKRTIVMSELKLPYWYHSEGLPGLDFNREIVEPGTNDYFPEGALGIRVDDSFWAVAALPLSEYRDKPLKDIVAEFWPDYIDQATYGPDHNTPEQTLFFTRREAAHYKKLFQEVSNELRETQRTVDRFQIQKPDICFRDPKRVELTTNYFVRQYEHLLKAFAHIAKPREDFPGICSVCNLLNSDRVHQSKWIDKHKEGFDRDLDFAPSVDKEIIDITLKEGDDV